MKTSPELALVLGVDAAGKSTFLAGLQNKLGYLSLEPTNSPEAKAFKAAHDGQLLDIGLVQQRRELFRKINASLGTSIMQELTRTSVATSGLRVVTDISHGVMGSIVGNQALSIPHILDDWMSHDSLLPDRVVLVHAPMHTIRDRIIKRQQRGVAYEQLTGFNSLYFLGQYQDALHEAADALSTSYPTLVIDTSQHEPSELLGLYEAM